MNYSLWNGDLHIHTNLSFCSHPEIVPSVYLPYCEAEKLTVLGFSNHAYYDELLGDGTVKGAGLARELQIKKQLEETQKTTNIKLLMGAEVETVVGREPSIRPEEAYPFDYILLAASHILNLPYAYDLKEFSNPDKLRALTINQFFHACELKYPVPTAICHPLYPICSKAEQEIVDGISDKQLEECFTCAKENNKGIEIHACLYRRGTKLNEDGISPSYLRYLTIAKECGCKFHFGGDAHMPSNFVGIHEKLRRAALSVGITENDMWTI